MLQQKQQRGELLRLQLEQQKRAQQPAPASSPVKRESGFSSCPLSCQPQGSAVTIIGIKGMPPPQAVFRSILFLKDFCLDTGCQRASPKTQVDI